MTAYFWLRLYTKLARKAAWQLVNRKANFFTKRIDSIRITNRIANWNALIYTSFECTMKAEAHHVWKWRCETRSWTSGPSTQQHRQPVQSVKISHSKFLPSDQENIDTRLRNQRFHCFQYLPQNSHSVCQIYKITLHLHQPLIWGPLLSCLSDWACTHISRTSPRTQKDFSQMTFKMLQMIYVCLNKSQTWVKDKSKLLQLLSHGCCKMYNNNNHTRSIYVYL